MEDFNLMNNMVKEHITQGSFYVFAIFRTTFGEVDADVRKELIRNYVFFAQREF